MRALFKLREIQRLTLATTGSYDVDYVYDQNGRIQQELVTGTITRTSTFTYDENDNVSTETIVEGGVTTLKTYTYNEAGDITKIQARKQ